MNVSNSNKNHVCSALCPRPCTHTEKHQSTPHNVLLLNDKDTVLQVDLLRQVHFARDGGEDETLLSAVRQWELNLPVQTTRAQEGGV